MPPRLPRLALRCPQLARPMAVSNAVRSLATTPAKSAAPAAVGQFSLPDDYVPPKQPPSGRRPENRQSQLIRSYTSLLRSTPVMLFFQQGNLTAVEWTAVRRELRRALDAVPPFRNADRQEINLAPYIQLQTITVRAFQVALKITEFFDPEVAKSLPTTPRTKVHGPLVHDLSSVAYEWIKKVEIPEDSFYKQLEGILQGPTAALALPAVSPAHLAAVLSVLSPSPQFPAPMRRKVPSYHDPIAQSGLKKLFLVGGRVEGKLFDNDGVKRVGGIQGGMDGLRAQLVSVLQGAGLSITSTLESTGRNLWVSLESHRFSVEEKQKEHEKGEKAEDARDAKHEEQEKSE